MQPAQNPPRGNCTENFPGQKRSWPEQETVQNPNFIKYWNRISPFYFVKYAWGEKNISLCISLNQTSMNLKPSITGNLHVARIQIPKWGNCWYYVVGVTLLITSFYPQVWIFSVGIWCRDIFSSIGIPLEICLKHLWNCDTLWQIIV